MSDTPIVDQQGNPVEETPITEAPQQPEQTTIELKPEDVKCGYVVAVRKNGEFVFETLGDQCGLIELLGVQKYAEHRITIAKDASQNHGYPVIAKQLDKVGQMLQVLLNLATQQTRSGAAPTQ